MGIGSEIRRLGRRLDPIKGDLSVIGGIRNAADSLTGKSAARRAGRAARSAAQLQADAAQEAIEFRREALAESRELQEPFLRFGKVPVWSFCSLM